MTPTPMDPTTRAARAFLATAGAVAVALALQVEWLETAHDRFALFCAVAAVLGALAWFYAAPLLPAAPEAEEPAPSAPWSGRARLALAVFAACFAAGLFLLQRDLRSIPGGWLWFGGGLGVLAATAAAEGSLRPSRRLASRGALAAGGLFLFALALRLYRLEQIPAELVDDEALIAEWGMQALHGQPIWDGATAVRSTFFRKGGAAEPMLGCVIHALVMAVAGENVFGLRLTAAIAGAAGVVLLYLVLRQFVGREASLAASFLLAICHTHLYWTRSGMLQSLVTLAATGAVYATLRGLGGRRYLPWLAAGALLGLAQHLYEGGRFLVLVFIAFVLWQAIADRRFLPRHWRNVLAMAAMAAAVFAPLGFWFVEHPDHLLAVSRGAFIFDQPEYLETRYPGEGAVGIVLGQLRRSLSGFAVRGDLGTFYPIWTPFFDPVVRALVLAGIAGFTLTLRPAFVLISLWLWVPVLITCTITVDPPPMSRLMMSVPALVAVAAGVLDRLGRLARLAYGAQGPALARGVAALLLGAAALWNLDVFFVHYPAVFPINLQTAAAEAVADAGSGYKAYFLGPPYLHSTAPTVRFLGRGVPRQDVTYDAIPVQERGHRGALFVVVPELPEVLERLREIYPEGVETERRRPTGELLFTTYRVERPELDRALGADAVWRQPDLRFGRAGDADGEIDDARALAVAGGRVYIADAGNRRVDEFDDTGGFRRAFATPGRRGVTRAFSVAVEDDGAVLVLDRDRRRIRRLTPTGERIGTIGGGGALADPLSLAVMPDGDVVVLDAGAPAVVRFSRLGEERARVGEAGRGPGQFESPSALAVGDDGRVYVADVGNGRVQRFSPSLEYETEWAIPLAPREPSQVIAVAGGIVYVVDGERGTVLRYDVDGAPSWSIGAKGDPPHDLAWPVAVAVDDRGRVWVLDTDRASVYRFDVQQNPAATPD